MSRTAGTAALTYACCGALAAICLPPEAARACRTPMCRYALLNWEPIPYAVEIVHAPGQTERAREAQRILEEQARDGRREANIKVMLVAAADGETSDAGDPSSASVRLRVRRPAEDSDEQAGPVIWSGEFAEDVVGRLLDSPSRQQLARQLREGCAAVWLLVETGDREADERAFRRLQGELERLSPSLEFSTDATAAAETIPSEKPRFAVVRVPAHDPAETWLVEAVLALAGRTKLAAPLTIPVYGRGHAHGFYAMDELSDAKIDATCRFLVGACSCTVRAFAPGHDLLIRADWRVESAEPLIKMIDLGPAQAGSPAADSTPPPAASVADASGAAAPNVEAAAPAQPEQNHVLTSVLFALGGIAVLVLAGVGVVLVRAGRASA